ncbi:NAD-dependent protein deacetylase hst1, partial [Neolecta irregularis DAH-3]
PDDVVKLLERCKNIVVLVGAGISTSLGIPDFRSSRGIYADVAGSGEVQDPQEIFNYDIFKQDPTLFYRYAHKIYPKTERVSPTHAFLRVLYEQHKLLRIYTQNIDNLEFKSGLPREKIVQCHGSFATASCMQCHQQVPGKEIERDILAGLVAYCSNPACIKEGTKTMREHANGKMKRKRRKRKNESDEEEERSQGVMKPDIIFFHENLPLEFFDTLHQKDKQKADLLIAIGTSLKVSPVAETIGILSMIPQIYISKTPVTHMNFDVCLLGPCDEIVCDLARRVNWKIDHDWISQKKSLRENVRYKRDGVLEYQWHLVE